MRSSSALTLIVARTQRPTRRHVADQELLAHAVDPVLQGVDPVVREDDRVREPAIPPLEGTGGVL
jgi:hypothetical protein